MTNYVNPSTRIGGVEQIVVPEREPTRMDDAPIDDIPYVRLNGEWVPLEDVLPPATP